MLIFITITFSFTMDGCLKNGREEYELVTTMTETF